MLGVQGWLGCPGCGAWGGREALCPRCGAVRGDRVPLDQSPEGGGWILAARGDVAEVRGALELRPDAEVSADASERLAVARRLLEAAPGDPAAPVSLWLDLRPAQAGHVGRRRSNAGVQDTVFVLPWLVLRREGREARIVRTVHQRAKRGLAGGTGPSTTVAGLDELVLLGPEGSARRPVARLERLTALDWAGLDPTTPEPAPLPPTAPGLPGAGGRAPLLAGLVAAAVLLGVCPALVRPFTLGDPDHVRGARARAVAALLEAERELVPDAADQVIALGADAREGVRAALRHDAPATRARALVAAASVLDRQERLRRLVEALRDPAGAAEVRGVAVELLGREGDLGATHLVAALRAAELEVATRAQALRVLVDHDPARAGAEALRLLGSPARAAPPLRRACLQALGAPGAVRPDDRGRALGLLERALNDDPDPACRERALGAFAGLGRGDPAVRARLLGLFAATLGPSPPGDLAWQAQLAGALVRAGAPAEMLATLRAHPGVGEPARRALARP